MSRLDSKVAIAALGISADAVARAIAFAIEQPMTSRSAT